MVLSLRLRLCIQPLRHEARAAHGALVQEHHVVEVALPRAAVKDDDPARGPLPRPLLASTRGASARGGGAPDGTCSKVRMAKRLRRRGYSGPMLRSCSPTPQSRRGRPCRDQCVRVLPPREIAAGPRRRVLLGKCARTAKRRAPAQMRKPHPIAV